LAPLPNVTFVPPQSDMRKVYAECKILLAPSVWEEAYGRVATEAQISGIPVVASARGGLPEAVGPGGVLLDPDQPIADWVAAVRKLWSDQDYYSALSAAATAHAARPEISFEHQVDAFERAMLDAAGYTSSAGREIAALEAEGFRLHRREGDECHFVKETRPPAETRRP
jgi:glycosyltransferase involved in cell wall biosynthesis